jgi:uncharacterized protein with NRDE domain
MLLTEHPPRWGGRDRLAGGTWLAVDPAGRLGAVTNRHPGGRPPERDASRNSRGSLPLDVLAGDDAAALVILQSFEPHAFNPVNVIFASTDIAAVTSIDDVIGRHMVRLTPGVHVLTEQDVDDPRDGKTQSIRRRAQDAVTASTPEEVVENLRELLRSHHADYDGSPACIHGDLHGTVSSATVVVATDGTVRYEHAEGPPCIAPFTRVL